MPSETTFFDARGNEIFSLPTKPRNTILYSPHGKFILVAGFGNLQGTVDIYDRQNKFSKVANFEASNTSVCEWSPCGRFILTATTSPRLRVDNGCKIWHASGKLVYLKNYNELLSIGWKPQSIENFPPLKSSLESSPEAHESAKEWLNAKEVERINSLKKPTGAYRPPHARNGKATNTTSLYEKELAGGGYTTTRPRIIPGAAAPPVKESKSGIKNRKKRESKKNEDEKDEKDQENGNGNGNNDDTKETNDKSNNIELNGGSVIGGISSIEEKKIRSLLKKLRAIETLKMKQANGDTLEDTQINKIKKEDEIRHDLGVLGWSD